MPYLFSSHLVLHVTSNRYAGLIARPNQIEENSIFFQVQYYFVPAHYVYESISMTWFTGDTRQVIVEPGTQYYDPLDCPSRLNFDGVCMVSISDYVQAFFGFKWS